VIVFPFHQDEHLSNDSIPVPAGVSTTLVDPASLPEGDDQWPRLRVLYDELAETVATGVRAQPLTTILCGDCLSMLGTMAGAQRAGQTPSVVWFDAHGDVHTMESSTSGYLGGMPLRMLVGGDPDRLSGPLGVQPIPETKALLIDARDLDPGEISYLEGSQVVRRSVGELTAADLPEGPVIIHVDLDVIDPSDLPDVRFPAPGGPSRSAVVAAIGRLLASGQVTVLDISCPWFDTTDPAQQAARQALLEELLALT